MRPFALTLLNKMLKGFIDAEDNSKVANILVSIIVEIKNIF
jgi:hypothetical protein